MRLVTRLCLSLLVLLLGAILIVPSFASAATGHERAAAQKVLGKRHAFGPYSRGWGHVRPGLIDNGGDPSGLVQHITWTKWGGAQAAGHGRTSIFKPGGGYYDKQVTARLRPADVGRCRPGGPLTYRKLWVREPKRPGGPLGPWFLWSGVRNLCHAMS